MSGRGQVAYFETWPHVVAEEILRDAGGIDLNRLSLDTPELLSRCPNLLASPHTAGVTHESRHRMGTFAAEQIIDILAGKRPARLINPAAWDAYCARFETIFGFQPKS